MSIKFRFLMLTLVLGLVLPSAGAQQPGNKFFTYEQVFAGSSRDRGSDGDSITKALPRIRGWLNDREYLETRAGGEKGGTQLYAVSAEDGNSRIYRDYKKMKGDLPDGFDPAGATATTEDLNRFLFDRDDDLYFYDAVAGKIRRLTATPGKERNPRFSPDGKWVAFTRGRNIFAYDLENSVEHQYTTDGSDTVYNGYASWVYYEEILGRSTRYGAFWWSPDSTHLAFLRFDDSSVPTFPIYRADGQHGELEVQRYPKAGDPNPYVAMGVVSATGDKVVWMDFEEKADHYIAWPYWTPAGNLMVQWMNRGQDTIRFYNCDPATGKKARVFEERQTSWVEFFDDIHYFSDGSGFLLRSDVDGWAHLYLYDSKGRLKKRLTSGNWRVSSINRVDEGGRIVYFMGHPEKTWDAQLMRVKLDGTGLETLTKGDGMHRSQVSPGGAYFLDTFSTITTPSKVTLFRGDGSLVREIGNSRTERTDEYVWGKAELFTIPSGDGFDLPAYWVLPPDFNPSEEYPVIFSIYGGPNSGRVRNRWLGLQPHYWAQRGVITISVDHRGSGHFGKRGVSLMHRNLGKWEMNDLIKAAEWLRTKPFIAKAKIGITGGSYGGYTTMMALTFGADHFNYGLARSSVSDWKLYDTVYTERYMDTPQENPEGYKDGSVLTWIDRYRGLLLITHGTIDDNVHMQNSMQVVDWLTSNDEHFEFMLYPDSRHGLQASQRAHSSREAHDFWVRHLLDGKLPKRISTSSP